MSWMKISIFIIEENRGQIAKLYKYPSKDYITYNKIIDAFIMFEKRIVESSNIEAIQIDLKKKKTSNLIKHTSGMKTCHFWPVSGNKCLCKK